ncbi:MAG: putative motility protein, partial [Spirochaetota bacterium]
TAMSQANVAQQANTAVLKESMNVQEMQGEGVNRLLSSAEQVSAAPQQVQDPMLAQTVDIKA